MSQPVLVRNPARRHLRHFAWIVALVLAVIALTIGSVELRWVAAVVFALGTVLPVVFRWPFIVLVSPVAWAVSRFTGPWLLQRLEARARRRRPVRAYSAPAR